jgi:hypothetical protein
MHNPMLWFIGLATPVAAHYMVPAQGSTYTVVSINGAFPILTSGVIGLELGIIASLLLTPLAYIYSRANRAKITPWQVEDVAPGNRIAISFGHWLADTVLLIFLLLILAVAGILLSFFRLELADIRPIDTIYTLLIIAVPAFAMIAAVKSWFTARPWLRGGLGDFCFFILWMTGVVMGAAFFESDGSAFIDVFGYAASINNAVNVPVEAFSVGSSPVSGDQNAMIPINAIQGVSDLEFLLSRGFWLVMAAALAILSGICFAPRQAKKPSNIKLAAVFNQLDTLIQYLLKGISPQKSYRFTFLYAQISQILTPKWPLLPLLCISVLGLYLPFKETIMPMLWLVLIFLLSAQSGRWQARTAKAYLLTMPVKSNQQLLMSVLSAVIFVTFLCIPSLISIINSAQYFLLVDVFLLCVGVPIIIYGLGRLTGSGTAARLLMLVAWYMYLNT